jgi:hypothetical protein
MEHNNTQHQPCSAIQIEVVSTRARTRRDACDLKKPGRFASALAALGL